MKSRLMTTLTVRPKPITFLMLAVSFWPQYWLIKILVYSGCLVGAGILVAFIGIKIAGLYKKYCWDMITILVTLISLEIAIYFGDWIKTVLPINMLFLLLLVQLVYVGIRWYVKGWQEARGYY